MVTALIDASQQMATITGVTRVWGLTAFAHTTDTFSTVAAVQRAHFFGAIHSFPARLAHTIIRHATLARHKLATILTAQTDRTVLGRVPTIAHARTVHNAAMPIAIDTFAVRASPGRVAHATSVNIISMIAARQFFTAFTHVALVAVAHTVNAVAAE